LNDWSLGEFCAGIGGFGLGFEQAGWRTEWQVELDDVNRACLAERFPRARQYKDARDWRRFGLGPVRCVAFGSPCQDISVSSNSKRDRSGHGLGGGRSGLFFTIMEAVTFLRPQWVVWENVPAIVNSNDGRDFQAVIGAFAERGYVGCWRVLDAQYFGVPQKRRRLVLVAGLGRGPGPEFLADAGAMESLPCSLKEEQVCRRADAWAGYTLTAPNKYGKCNSRVNLGSEVFVAETNGWSAMVERAREVELHGIPQGLDAVNSEEAYAAGNAFPPPMARWVAGILRRVDEVL
jgi:DNA (cytosine-5)-methyltransferase 1